MTHPNWRPCRSDLTEREIDGDFLIHNPKTGSVHLLNSVAAFVLGLCDGSRQAEAIIVEIAERFHKTTSEIEADIQEVLRDFLKYGLVSERNG